MSIDIPRFREIFPAVAGSDVTDTAINYWYGMALDFMSSGWSISGDASTRIYELMTAHLLYLANSQSGSDGSSSGGGIVASASEGSVSVSFSTPTTKTGWQFWLASSPYGMQLWALLQMKGAGGAYIGGLPERSAVRKVGGVFL